MRQFVFTNVGLTITLQLGIVLMVAVVENTTEEVLSKSAEGLG